MAIPFRKALLGWYTKQHRDLPWRRTGDPYLVWISEIMLQQTRVDQAMPYYERFVSRFPDVASLAAADVDEVLRLWEGLGYYSRARNMLQAARHIVANHAGVFPASLPQALALKGVGPYTAAAVLSIAHNQPHAVVDGNVIRVLSRLFAISDDVRKTATLRRINALADQLLDTAAPGKYNQAMMELGATVCTPARPDCEHCPVASHCQAFGQGIQHRLPFKSPAKKKPHHHIAIGVIHNDDNRLLIARRPEQAMLGGLWEFPGGKQEPGERLTATVRRELHEELGVDVAVAPEPFTVLQHAYSHFSITLHAFHARLQPGSAKPASRNGEPVVWVEPAELTRYAFPRANRKITEFLVRYEAGEGSSGERADDTRADDSAKVERADGPRADGVQQPGEQIDGPRADASTNSEDSRS